MKMGSIRSATTGLLVALVLSPPPVRGAPPDLSVNEMYAHVVAEERAVRTALADADLTTTILKAVRTVIADYEAIVRTYPTSGYCDDALWRAGQLSLDAFARFGQVMDQNAGVRLLRWLTTEYPTSRLAKRAPAVIATSDTPRAGAAAPLRAPPEFLEGTSRGSLPPPRIVTIKDIRRTVLPDAVRITIELDAEVTFHDARLANPARVYVDLASARAVPELVDRTLRFDVDADLVRQVRLGRHPHNTTRVVLETAGISSYSIFPLYSPYRLVIDCLRQTSVPLERWLTVAPFAILAPSLSPPARLRPETAPAQAQAPILAATPSTLASASASLSIPVSPPARNLAGGFSMARQLGLGVSRIVIDPGHGGQDPGAVGRGLTEASLVLDVSLRLEKLLAKMPDVEVILTRRTDAYLPLQERTAVANREGSDLFLSIHANASSNTRTSGVETYFLNFATNASAAAIAARENAASGEAMRALPDIVRAIALNNKLDESRDFATFVQRAMIERLAGLNKEVKDLGVKQAPFVVLIGATMPSVLAEISFLTNAQEVRLLQGSAYRQRIAEAFFIAIRRYQASLNRVGKVAAGR